MKGGETLLDWSIIGLKIKQKRKECKITQPDLALKIGKTESSIRKYEKGLVNIPTDVLEKIAEALNTTPFELIGPEWFDMKIGPDNVDLLRREVSTHEGILAILEDIYGSVESKEISSNSNWSQFYYLIGQSFILHDKDLETLIRSTKALIPVLIDLMKDTRPEETVVQEMLKEMNALPDPEK